MCDGIDRLGWQLLSEVPVEGTGRSTGIATGLWAVPEQIESSQAYYHGSTVATAYVDGSSMTKNWWFEGPGQW